MVDIFQTYSTNLSDEMMVSGLRLIVVVKRNRKEDVKVKHVGEGNC